jgi:hypothetical protein
MPLDFRLHLSPLALAWALSFATASDGYAQWRLLVFSETAGFRHSSIDDGQMLLADLGETSGFATTESEDSSIFSSAGLAPFHAVVFLNTTGDVLTAAEEAG